MQNCELRADAKAPRRSRRQLKSTLLKIGVLTLLAANVATAIYLKTIGY